MYLLDEAHLALFTARLELNLVRLYKLEPVASDLASICLDHVGYVTSGGFPIADDTKWKYRPSGHRE